MNKSEALGLQTHVEELLEPIFEGANVDLSCSLSNRIQVSFDGDKINFNRETFKADWINFSGDLSELKDFITKAEKVLKANSSVINRLMWSYDNMSILKDDLKSEIELAK
jgi:hypothetical protein